MATQKANIPKKWQAPSKQKETTTQAEREAWKNEKAREEGQMLLAKWVIILFGFMALFVFIAKFPNP